MKLIIQIPCYNEAQTLPTVLRSLPQHIPGISQIETQIIDDGCTDNTVEIAKRFGVKHIVSVQGQNRRWLGRAFKLGIQHALSQGADLVVNTDGDNQYPAAAIPDLVKPIVSGQAQIAIGNREPEKFREFSFLKRCLQKLGNLAVSFITGHPTPDAVSGFRAYSKEALLQIHVITNYTYTVDTLIQAYKKGIDVVWIPIVPNPKTRESRLIKNLFSKVRKSGSTILRMSTVYAPFKTFSLVALSFAVPGSILLLRYLYIYLFLPTRAAGHVQSVVIGGILIVISIQLFALGIIGDLLAVNRTLLEEALTRARRHELHNGGRDKVDGASPS